MACIVVVLEETKFADVRVDRSDSGSSASASCNSAIGFREPALQFETGRVPLMRGCIVGIKARCRDASPLRARPVQCWNILIKTQRRVRFSNVSSSSSARRTRLRFGSRPRAHAVTVSQADVSQRKTRVESYGLLEVVNTLSKLSAAAYSRSSAF